MAPTSMKLMSRKTAMAAMMNGQYAEDVTDDQNPIRTPTPDQSA
jgi:hypothetical protein